MPSLRIGFEKSPNIMNYRPRVGMGAINVE